MKIDNTEVWGFRGAIRGMRNPMNSWDRSDSVFSLTTVNGEPELQTTIGKNDLELCQRLIKAGPEHRKFMRQIYVTTDIEAPSYWISELDTYKVGTSRNSCSFQHKGVSKPFTIRDFELMDIIYDILDPIKIKKENEIVIPYETDEYKTYKIYDREYSVYRNGRIFAEPFSYTDTLGRTRTFERKEKIPTQSPEGYWYMNFGGRYHHERWLVHRLVAELWLEHEPGLEVNHKDGNKGNNSVENLEWVTRSQNEAHKYETGLYSVGLDTKYKAYKANTIIDSSTKYQMKKLKETHTYKELSKLFNISEQRICSVLNDNPAAYTSDYHNVFEYCATFEKIIDDLNQLRELYLETGDYNYFVNIRCLLPMSYKYKFTWSANYEVLRNIYFQRRNHKLKEWSIFCDWIKELPYANELITLEK